MITPSDLAAQIEELYRTRGSERYGEELTLFEHSLLTAQTAQDSGASDELVLACLLHDVGHLLVEPDDAYGSQNHDEVGAEWLGERFGAAVSEPVRLHVAAKRYLCAMDPGYYGRLSAASQYSLGKQGGRMSDAEADEFTTNAFWEDAARLRHWEDAFGKDPDAAVPDFDRYRPLIEALATG